MESKLESKNLKRPIKRKELTLKQETFCQEYIKNGGNAAQALRDSYDVENMKESAVYHMASQTLLNPMIIHRMHELKREHGKKYAIDREFITESLVYALTIARDKKSTSEMRRTAMDIAKLHGLIVEKQDVNMSGNLQVMKNVEIDGEKIVFNTGLGINDKAPVIDAETQIVDISEEGASDDTSDIL